MYTKKNEANKLFFFHEFGAVSFKILNSGVILKTSTYHMVLGMTSKF